MREETPPLERLLDAFDGALEARVGSQGAHRLVAGGDVRVHVEPAEDIEAAHEERLHLVRGEIAMHRLFERAKPDEHLAGVAARRADHA